MLAHSLDIILRFPHHLTLLSILLDVSLQHDLYHESCVLLHWLLRTAVSASEQHPTPRLCHPAHSTYLIDLCRKWREANLPTSAFSRILATILVEAPRSEQVWACKAVARLARELHIQDFPSLLNMASHVLSSLADVRTEESPLHKCRTSGTNASSLVDQLNKWLNYSSSLPPSQDSTLEFLDQCRLSGVHRNTSEPLAATVVCWATHCLPTATPSAAPSLHRLLKDISPTVPMYNLLVEKSFGVNQMPPVKLEDSRAILQVYAECLRANNLLLLEASLWACALRFTETSSDLLGACALRSEINLYREELIVLVDDAERRCFQAPESGWEWEEWMGCWVQRDLPPAKKAKHRHELQQSASGRHGCDVAKPCPLADIKNEVIADEDHHDYASAFELSFTSLISNALSSRTKLHAHSGRRTALLSPHTKMYPSDDTIPSSDDALNLFAYTEG